MRPLNVAAFTVRNDRGCFFGTAERMRRDWRILSWLSVCVAGAAICIWWWALTGFQVPICRDASATDHCLSYDETRAWPSQGVDPASRPCRACEQLGCVDNCDIHRGSGGLHRA